MQKMTRNGLCVLSLFFALPALAWGEIGHRVVGEIAQRHLSPLARQKLKSIVGKESIARASTWPDEVRSDPLNYAYATPWHFVDLEDGKSYGQNPPAAEGNIYTALLKLEAELRASGTSLIKKREAIRFIAHFIGDLHQPLHVGNGLDRGGNWCSVTYMNRVTNLHSVWDSDLIDGLKLSYTEYARFLEDALTETDKGKWYGGDYLQWIVESQQYRTQLYPRVELPEGQVQGTAHPYCRDPKLGPLDPALIPKLSYEYAFKHRPLLDQRLTQAGLRLAFVLNRVFSGKSVAAGAGMDRGVASITGVLAVGTPAQQGESHSEMTILRKFLSKHSSALSEARDCHAE